MSFGLVATEEPVSAYMFAVDCDIDETSQEQAIDLLASASGQQNTNVVSVNSLLAVQISEYSQFVELREAADKLTKTQKGDPTVFCNVQLHDHAHKCLSNLTFIWHPVALNAIQAQAPLWKLLRSQDELMSSYNSVM